MGCLQTIVVILFMGVAAAALIVGIIAAFPYIIALVVLIAIGHYLVRKSEGDPPSGSGQ